MDHSDRAGERIVRYMVILPFKESRSGAGVCRGLELITNVWDQSRVSEVCEVTRREDDAARVFGAYESI